MIPFSALSALPLFQRGRLRRAWTAAACLAITFSAGIFAPALQAQTTLYWDTNAKAAGTGSAPAGTWSASSGTNWTTDSGGKSTTSTWTNGSDAVFSAGTNGTGAYTVTVSGTVEVSSVMIGEGTPTFTGGTIKFTDSTPDFIVGNGLTATVNSVIAPNYWTGLAKSGTGTLVLTAANTYNAGTAINAGTLVAANDAALGAASSNNVVARGATLALQGNIALAQNNLTLTGGGASGTGALVNLSGGNSTAAYTSFGGDTTIGSAAGTLTLSGTVALGRNDVTVTGAGNTTFSGAVNGDSDGSLTYRGTGTLTLSGSAANTFGSTLDIASGTVVAAKSGGALATNGGAINVGDGAGSAASAVLRLDADQQLARYTSLLTVNSDGKLALSAHVTQTLDRIAGTGRIDLAGGSQLIVGADWSTSTFAGSLSGAGTLEKIDGGTLTFDSSFNFDGTLALNGGTLALNGVTLDLGTLHITGNSILDFGSGAASTLNVANLIVDSGVTLTIRNWSQGVDALFAQAWSGATLGQSGSAPTNQIVFDGYSNDDTRWQSYDHQVTPVGMTPVPEPAATGAALTVFILILYALRRRSLHERFR